jgi:TolB-like protein/Tfp pilus assembly protein PilF
MYTDMVGYTALGQRDESLSLALVEAQQKVLGPVLARHSGRVVKTMGDAFLVEFTNALEATRCAYDVQRSVKEFNLAMSNEKRIHLRVGIHLGDVVEKEGDILGDAVNVASRIEPLAEDGGVCLTQQVYDQVKNKLDVPLVSKGKMSLKNVSEPVEVYKMVMPWDEEKVVPSAQLDLKRVAVMPLASLSPDPNDEFFADGLTEELIDKLCQIRELQVIARTSVMVYKKKEKRAAEIGRELGAGGLVEGSVRKAGNRIRVTAQLIDTNTEGHLWSSRYDRDLQDIFAVQSDIAEQVAEALRVKLLPNEKKAIEKKATENTEAYTLCLKGRYYFNELTKEDNNRALRYFEEAVKLDPNCALAYSGIADCYHYSGDLDWLPPQEAYPKSRIHALKAIEIDPMLAEAHAALGAEYFHYDWKWRESEEELTHAIALRPSYAAAHDFYATLLAFLLRFDESYEHIRRAYELDPLANDIGADLGGRLSTMGRQEEAIAHLEKMARMNPDFAYVHSALGWAYYRAGRTEEAVSELKTTVRLSHEDPGYLAGLAQVLGWTGKNEEAESILLNLQELSKSRYVSNVGIAGVFESIGKRDEAFERLEIAYQGRAGDLLRIRVAPEMSELKKDPRWLSIEGRMGLPHT